MKLEKLKLATITKPKQPHKQCKIITWKKKKKVWWSIIIDEPKQSYQVMLPLSRSLLGFKPTSSVHSTSLNLLFSKRHTQPTFFFFFEITPLYHLTHFLLLQASTNFTAYPLLHCSPFKKCLHLNYYHGKVVVSLPMCLMQLAHLQKSSPTPK